MGSVQNASCYYMAPGRTNSSMTYCIGPPFSFFVTDYNGFFRGNSNASIDSPFNVVVTYALIFLGILFFLVSGILVCIRFVFQLKKK